ncbi:CBY1-interacting BAR domain-containing protein 1 isoform X1 [Hydra vulgaris]|uniref:Protein FAM92A1 n=1 Tax=Hydra vulgaris TaxID=6087 RepID=T2MK59_HYDVU|nr:CBY1-interacting BAR domain-containing protein 1 isoform X1 [Hydra vulgaris]
MYGTSQQPLYSPSLKSKTMYMSQQDVQRTSFSSHNPQQRFQQRSYSTGDLKTSIRSGEQQTKVVTENIEKIENHFPQLVHDINLYTVRSAKLRDAGDNMAKSIRLYADSETSSIKQGLGALAECFASVQDQRNALVTRLEKKVFQTFAVYDTRCKQAKVDVKKHSLAHSKELIEHKSYERVKQRSVEHFQLAKAETKFKKASEEAHRSAQILEEQMDDFERKKIRDLKQVFGDFMLSEMLFYAKALEIYTLGYQELMSVDEDKSIEQLHESMQWTPHQFVQSSLGAYGGSAPTILQQNP